MTVDVQFWLAELDQHGNPKLVDGAHSAREGADKAAYLYQQLGFARGKRLAVARVELSEPTPSSKGVNQEALAACQGMIAATKSGDKA
ncbi:hypothetical protein GCT13_08425 [Paraburkholderia sp. CNPSo 3157]|uniref:Uncharacterized protein n=1 Tax=Paraburkholderia franconis TaxID=2654983 RepID=A0A7X1N8H1_9BURK|nr:hypothetical protein [Paraburkholderia franconis]MPW16956.1 hypothetical protein [Paraburkholderia franconis]